MTGETGLILVLSETQKTSFVKSSSYDKCTNFAYFYLQVVAVYIRERFTQREKDG